jgi:hypothetical protein
MRIQSRTGLIASALLLLSSAWLCAGSRPITLSDGSVCLADEGQPLPDTSAQEYQRSFKLASVFLERLGAASADMKGCIPLATKCPGCEEFRDVRSVVVQFRDGNTTRNVALAFDGSTVRVNTVGSGFADWLPLGNSSGRKKVKRNGKIQWIFVDGQPFDCQKNFCRITFQNED